MTTPSSLYDEILSTIWFFYTQGSHYSVRISHEVHEHLLTFFWVKPHTVLYTIIMHISKYENSELE